MTNLETPKTNDTAEIVQESLENAVAHRDPEYITEAETAVDSLIENSVPIDYRMIFNNQLVTLRNENANSEEKKDATDGLSHLHEADPEAYSIAIKSLILKMQILITKGRLTGNTLAEEQQLRADFRALLSQIPDTEGTGNIPTRERDASDILAERTKQGFVEQPLQTENAIGEPTSGTIPFKEWAKKSRYTRMG